MGTIRKLLGITAMTMTVGACESATLPEGMAAVEVAAEGDGGTPGTGTAGASGSAEQGTGAGEVEGTVEFRARVWARTTVGEWVELTGGAAKQVAVDAGRSGGARMLVTAHVEAESYNRLRVEFEEVKARVDGGATVDSELWGLDVRVELGSNGKAVVERSIDLRTTAGSRSRLVIDLNASQWLSRANASTRATARADFESAVRIYSR